MEPRMAKFPEGEARATQTGSDSFSAPEGASKQLELDLVRYKGGDKPAEFTLDLLNETIWATTAQIADLFGVGPDTVAHHIAAVQAEETAGRPPKKAPAPAENHPPRAIAASAALHDLDTVLSVGYRVASAKAAAFRKWATATLRAYVVDGYAINEARLREDLSASTHLAARLRAIRASESNVYESVRAFFQAASDDYDAGSRAARVFSALLEEKFYFAVTGETASQIVIERADHAAPDMGLRRFEGAEPSIDDAKVARNYLDRDELHVMHMLCEQFLLYIESKALRGQPMTMQDLTRKLDHLLKVEDYPVLPDHKVLHQDRAIRHAQAEYARFIMRQGSTVKSLPNAVPEDGG